ncbi:MAG: precorrin-2 C(20)-methyltransferase [Sciscionella sp.]
MSARANESCAARTPQLVGVGVGPGDPELLTLAGLRALREADVVYVPVLAPTETGRAEAVVRAHLGAARKITRLVFALNHAVAGSQQPRRQRWDEAAERVVAGLDHGTTAVFATIGDPSVYSTFGYLAATVRNLLPQVRVRTVPGITAVQAAASECGITLVEGAEPLTLVPVSRDLAGFASALAGAGTVVAYKSSGRFAALREVVRSAGALDRAYFAEHLGTPDERVRPLSTVGEDEAAPYLSTVLVLPRRGERGEQL